MRADTDAHRRLTEAFESFEASLRDLLTTQARESVDQALDKLSLRTGPFRINDVQVDVVIRGLNVEATQEHGKGVSRRYPEPGRKRSTKRARSRRSTVGRPPGALRSALIDIFADTESELDTDALRAVLDARGVKTSTDNLHQQLRRLVTAGILERVGRGRYRRAEA